MYKKIQKSGFPKNTIILKILESFDLKIYTIILKAVSKLRLNFKLVLFELCEELPVKERHGYAESNRVGLGRCGQGRFMSDFEYMVITPNRTYSVS